MCVSEAKVSGCLLYTSIAPASADIIARIAAGLADDTLTSTTVSYTHLAVAYRKTVESEPRQTTIQMR